MSEERKLLTSEEVESKPKRKKRVRKPKVEKATQAVAEEVDVSSEKVEEAAVEVKTRKQVSSQTRVKLRHIIDNMPLKARKYYGRQSNH